MVPISSSTDIVCTTLLHCQCPRFQVTVPEGRTPFTEWLWLEYEEFGMSMSILVEDGKLTIQSATCLNDHEPCWECQKLKMRFPITHIQDRMNQDLPENTPYKYLGMKQMVELLWRKDRQINDLKLISLNCRHRLGTLTVSNLDYKRFAMAISQCDAPHINVLVQSALGKKHGIREIIQLLTRAMLGTYHPNYMEEQHLRSVVLYQLGGGRCNREYRISR